MALPASISNLHGLALCAGVGGLELGLHIALPGYRTVCYVEREAHAAATLVARMEDKTLDYAPVWDDVATFNGRSWRGRVDIVTAGYPCQPFSQAGRRRGHVSSSLKTCPAISRWGIPSSADSWKRWVSALRKESTQRLKSAEASYASGFLCWPAVTSTNCHGNEYTRDKGKKGAERLTLVGRAKLWPATRASDALSGLQIKDGKRGLSLITVTKLWPALTARDYRVPASPAAQERRETDSKRGVQLAEYSAHHWPGEDCLSSLHALLTTLDGWTCCQQSRRLSPLFAEMLMGWPAGWTDCTRPVTGWSHWLQLTRLSLSQLVSVSTLAAA